MSSILTKHISPYVTASHTLYKLYSHGLINTRYINILGSNIVNFRHSNVRERKYHSFTNDILVLRPRNQQVSNTKTILARYMSSKGEEYDLPILSDLPRRVIPNFMHYLRSVFFIHGLIVPYFDDEFTKESFMDGATKAVEVVSNALSEGDFDALETLVEKKCLDDIKRKLSFSSAYQRERLKVKAENIYGQFLYEIGIMFDDEAEEEDAKQQRRWVEITFVAHSHPDFNNTLDDDVSVLQNSVNNKGSTVKRSVRKMQDLVESNGGPMILNYRFLREFTKGVDPSSTSWSISAINHFKLNDNNL